MDAQLDRVRKRHVTMLQRDLLIFTHIINGANPADLTARRDGPDGWTPLEILCHVRDLDPHYNRRAHSVVEQDKPDFVLLPVNQLAIERNYNGQDPAAVLAEFAQVRDELLAYFASVPDADWSRTGVHPEQGEQTLLDVLIHAAHHDQIHIEQMTRVLAQK